MAGNKQHAIQWCYVGKYYIWMNINKKKTCDYITPNADGMITRKEQVKDLGIIMNEKSDFTDHIHLVSSIH